VIGVAASFALSMAILGFGVLASLAASRAAVLASIAGSAVATMLAGGGPVCTAWLNAVDAPLCIGVDNVSKLFALLSAFVAASTLVYVEEAGVAGRGGRTALRLIVVALHASVIGLVYSYSLPAFYIFWELVLVSSTALIWLWERRRAHSPREQTLWEEENLPGP
jgi:formate hydrogenlyase subunit 3/multisubunit Na+/H+ antiporter MnhD subunit